MDDDQLFELLPDAALIADAMGIVRRANGACGAMFGYGRGELVGLPVEELVSEAARAPHAELRRAYQRTATPRAMAPGRALWGRHRDGRGIAVDVALGPLPDGSVLALVRRVSQQAALDLNARVTTAAVAAAANGIVITDARGIILHVNDAFSRLSGYAPDEVLGSNPRFLKSGVHDEAFYRELWQTVASGRVWSGEVVNRRRDGTTYVEEQTITPVRDDAGAVTHFVAIKQDVTQRRADEAALVRRLDELTLLHELALLSVSGMTTTDLALRAAAIVKGRLGLAALRITHDGVLVTRPPEEPALGETGTELESALRFGAESFGTFTAVFPPGAAAGEHEKRLLDTAASQLALAMKNAALVEELAKHAHTDALTGLENRRRFFERGMVEVERAQRYGRPLSLVIVDVDHFKIVNDTFGHAHGDEVLRRLGAVLLDCCRRSDVVARLGGEEFVLLLAETSLEGALACVERVREELELGRDRGLRYCEFSAGLADHGPDHQNLEAMMRAADEALYAAKNAGRNTAVVRRSRRATPRDFMAMRRSSQPPSSRRNR